MRTWLFALLLCGLVVQWPTRGQASSEGVGVRLVPVSAQASSSSDPDSGADKAVDNNPQTRWSSLSTDREWLTVDLGEEKTIGGVTLVWEAACGEVYQIQLSADGQTWFVAFTETAGEPGTRHIAFTPVSGRYVRMHGVKRKTEWGYSLFAFDVLGSPSTPVPLANLPAVKDFRFSRIELRPKIHSMAAAGLAPAGHYPRWLGNEQEYWTVTGTPEGFAESLISEDGTVELHPRCWSLMPYLWTGGRLVTSRDAEVSQELEQGYLPIPSVTWKAGDLRFTQKLFTWGKNGQDTSYLIYTVENSGAREQEGALFITIRPFQVTPFWQGEGGMAQVFNLRLGDDPSGHLLFVNGTQLLYSVTPPDASGGISFQEGDVMDFVPHGDVPPHVTVRDPWGGATAALRYNFRLGPGERAEYVFAAPLRGTPRPDALDNEAVRRELATARAFWEEELNRIRIELPDPYLFDVLRANLAYMLINRDGPVLQPGSRHYERSWIRDGALMAIALLQTGHPEAAREYQQWAADHQLFSGDVPCMINADGSMWEWGKALPEYDGQGAFVTMASENYAYTKDRELLQGVFTNVTRALEFLDYLRKKRLTDEFRLATDERARFYGILPLSVSHEGYAAPGKHSYWDNFWAIKGWREGQSIARILGRNDLIGWMEAEENGLRSNLLASIRSTQRDKDVKFIPGCADLGDCDPTSTTIAIWPTEEYIHFPKEELLLTFDIFYQDTFLRRLGAGAKPDDRALPYEMRSVTAYLILGQKEKAWNMMNYFLQNTRPRPWAHWGEVIYSDYRKPGYIGDMPHSWGGADYMHALRTMLAHEGGGQLVLGLGLKEDWVSEGQKVVSVSGLPTHYGKISYTVRGTGTAVNIRVEGQGIEPPPGGYVFRSPRAMPIRQATLGGQVYNDFSPDEVRFSELPAEIELLY